MTNKTIETILKNKFITSSTPEFGKFASSESCDCSFSMYVERFKRSVYFGMLEDRLKYTGRYITRLPQVPVAQMIEFMVEFIPGVSVLYDDNTGEYFVDTNTGMPKERALANIELAMYIVNYSCPFQSDEYIGIEKSDAILKHCRESKSIRFDELIKLAEWDRVW